MAHDVTFVFGAGSSKEFGLPLGSKLYKEIIGDLTGWGSLSKLLVYLDDVNLGETDTKNLANSLLLSPLNSIDEFIHNYCKGNTETETLLKFLISKNILTLENHDLLFDREVDNWYRYVISFLIRNADGKYQNFIEQPVNFVTFNYDRTLEWFLYHGIQSTYPAAKENTKVFNKWFDEYCEKRIFHMYGSLGPIREVPFGLKKNFQLSDRRFGQDKIVEFYLAGSKNLDLMRFGQKANPPSELKQIFDKTNRTFFIGFGYQRDNLIQLPIKKGTRLNGSCYGVKEEEKRVITQVIKKLFNSKIHLNGDRPEISDDLKCSVYYRSFCDLLAI